MVSGAEETEEKEEGVNEEAKPGQAIAHAFVIMINSSPNAPVIFL